MIKRDWKLPNPSYFTYTSIVQPVLQVYNPFLQTDSPFSPSKVANSKREKQLQNDIKGVDLSHRLFKGPPNALIGYPNGLGALIPHFTSKQVIFTVLNAANLSGKNKRVWAWVAPLFKKMR